MELNENIAEVTFNPKTKQVTKLALYQKLLRFKCKRCATFCCKLGGPKLLSKDIERMEEAGYPVEEYLEPVLKDEFKGLPPLRGNLKNREDGSCIFLKFHEEKGIYECSIYQIRPTLCRLYPFYLNRTAHNSFVLKLIPCCRGLNNPDGELVDQRFITNYLLDAILNIMIESNTHMYAEMYRDKYKREEVVLEGAFKDTRIVA